jgi:hypothetical protein
MNVYLAGKIGSLDFRYGLVPGLRGRTWNDGPIICPGFTYVGPFFVACGHQCAHGPATHGALIPTADGCGAESLTHRQIYEANQTALASASLVFAYIDETECNGTLYEIGWAAAKAIPIIIIFSPDIDKGEFWYSTMPTEFTAVASREELPALFARLLHRFATRDGCPAARKRRVRK